MCYFIKKQLVLLFSAIVLFYVQYCYSCYSACYIVFAQMLYTAILLFTLFCYYIFFSVFAQMLYTAILLFTLFCYYLFFVCYTLLLAFYAILQINFLYELFPFVHRHNIVRYIFQLNKLCYIFLNPMHTYDRYDNIMLGAM